MGKDIERAISLIEEAIKKSETGWIARTDLFNIFIDQTGFSESKFNSIVFLLKAKKIISQFNYAKGFYINKKEFEKFKKKWR